MSPDPCDPVMLHSPDGATLTVCPHGGHVLGWSPQPGHERLYLSPTSRCGAGLAIRGGVPVIFPQFSGRGPLPKHGFARDRAWDAQELEDPLGAVWRARLEADDATLAIWPHRFALELTARATVSELEITVEVSNLGDEPFSFALALHGYLRLVSPEATISGLGGLPVEQNAAPGRSSTSDDDGDWLALEPRDVRVIGVPGPVVVHDPGQPGLTLTAPGFPDRVVWNPGTPNGLADMPDGDERGFVCVEPAVVDPLELAPGESWTGHQLVQL